MRRPTIIPRLQLNGPPMPSGSQVCREHWPGSLNMRRKAERWMTSNAYKSGSAPHGSVDWTWAERDCRLRYPVGVCAHDNGTEQPCRCRQPTSILLIPNDRLLKGSDRPARLSVVI